jgi:hypothetical protein
MRIESQMMFTFWSRHGRRNCCEVPRLNWKGLIGFAWKTRERTSYKGTKVILIDPKGSGLHCHWCVYPSPTPPVSCSFLPLAWGGPLQQLVCSQYCYVWQHQTASNCRWDLSGLQCWFGGCTSGTCLLQLLECAPSHYGHISSLGTTLVLFHL